VRLGFPASSRSASVKKLESLGTKWKVEASYLEKLGGNMNRTNTKYLRFNSNAALAGCLGAILLAASFKAGAQTIALHPVADTSLRDNVPNNNFGAAPDLPLGVAVPGAPRNRVLLKFDLAAIPENATITSATLELSVVLTGTGPAVFGLHRALQDWGEGTKSTVISGAPATEGEATWNVRFHPSTFWASSGGGAGTDYVELPSATGSLEGPGSRGAFNSEQMAADIRAWLADPGANFGWFVIAVNEPAGTGKRVGSRENPSPELRPLLTVEYTVAEPQQLELFDTALTGNQIRFSFHAEPNRAYAVEFRDSLTAGGWDVLAELPEQPAAGDRHITNTISSVEGYFRVRTP
jgi:hypothetical protein